MIGQTLGPYRVLAKVGEGGMGEVYRAHDTRLGRDVAIKVLPADGRSAEARQRFEREARAVAALQHPNICTVFDVGETADGQDYLVMELLRGVTVHEQTARGQPLSLAELIDAGIALADALDTAHSAGIVHRDIKPANILLTPRGPKILDFGIAKTTETPSSVDATTEGAFLTERGSTLGTLSYMSSEQLRGETVDARSDLFSLGLVLYEMITGRRAFTGDTTAVATAALLHEEPVPPRAARPDLPASLEAVVLKALEKDRALRYQHAAELRSDLLRVKRDLTSAPATIDTPVRSGHRARPRTIAAAAGAVVVAMGVAAFVYWRPAAAAPLSETDTIVLADFSNTTADPVFDDTLRQGLSVQLQQSPFLSLVPETRIRRTLALMGQPSDARLTPELAEEVCERVGATAALDGSIAALGTQYVIGLRARNCATGDVLAEEQVQAARKEDVLDALSRVATAFRTRVGESLATLTKYSTPLQEATTSSLEALKTYTEAHRITLSEGMSKAVPVYRRALALDPEFAIAHGELGLAYSTQGETGLSIDHTRRAFELRDRATERERFQISALYERQVTGNLEKARQVFESWVQAYPRDDVAHSLYAGFTAHGTGRYERAIELSEKSISLNPDNGYGYGQIGLASLCMDQLDGVRQALARAEQRKLEMEYYRLLRFWIAFITGDTAAMDQVVAKADARADSEITNMQSLVAAVGGRLQHARELSRRAMEIKQRNGQAEAAATYAVSEAVWEAVWGHADAARTRANFALGLAKGRDVEFGAALAMALSGDAKGAQNIAEQLASRFPEDTSVQSNYLPVLRAFRSIAANEPGKALEALEANRPYERATPAINFNWSFGGRYPLYLRGVALTALGRQQEAVTELRKLLDQRGLLLGDSLGALARVQLARAYAKAGDVSNARATYESFFELTQDADAGLPLSLQARQEFARLK
jgi:serine/threonine protein kinase/TolA-binding protein